MLSQPSIQHPSRKLFALAGELLHKKDPATYAKLIQLIPQYEKPDQIIISKDFLSFCQIQQINPEEYRGNIYKHSKTEQKSLFVAVIIAKYGRYTRNVPKYLSAALNQNKNLTGRMIEEAETRYRCSTTFKLEIDNIIEKMNHVPQV